MRWIKYGSKWDTVRRNTKMASQTLEFVDMLHWLRIRHVKLCGDFEASLFSDVARGGTLVVVHQRSGGESIDVLVRVDHDDVHYVLGLLDTLDNESDVLTQTRQAMYVIT